MTIRAFLGILLLMSAAAVSGLAQTQDPKPGIIPTGLADGPYVHLMAQHHDEGIKMATLATAKAANADVKALAGRMLDRQRKELAELKQFKTTVAEDMAPRDRIVLKQMRIESLEQATGAAFDRLFLSMMIEHHRDALTMTNGAKLVIPRVQDFAKTAAQRLNGELKEMQAISKTGLTTS